jgi:hypothetical protein
MRGKIFLSHFLTNSFAYIVTALSVALKSFQRKQNKEADYIFQTLLRIATICSLIKN